MVEACAGVAAQRPPFGAGRRKQVRRRRARATGDIIDDLVVGRHQRDARAAFDRHVADRHAGLDPQRVDRLACKFDGMADRAVGADAADHFHDQILGGDTGREGPVDRDAHRFEAAIDQRLGGQQMLDIRRPDPETDHAERPIGCRMAVARRDHHARQHKAEFGHHDMLDPLSRIEEVEDLDSEIAAIFAQILDLPPRAVVEFARIAVGVGRIDMVNDPQRRGGAPDLPPGGAQPAERLGACIFIEHRSIDIEQ